MVKRRKLLGCGAAGIATASALAACSKTVATIPAPDINSTALPSVRWRLTIAFPKFLDVLYDTAESICQRVSEMTDGKFVIIPHAPGEIAPTSKVTEAVRTGEAECGFTAGVLDGEEYKAFYIFSSLPFGLTAQQHNAWLYYGGGLEILQKQYASIGIKSFPASNTGTQMGGWFRKEINTLEDLKGLKFRVPGLAAEVFKQLGGEAVSVAPDKIFTALEQGTIDAAEFLGPYDDEKLGLNRVAPYYYYPGWWEPGTSHGFNINMAAWEALPVEYQRILEAVIAEGHIKTIARYDTVNSKSLQKLLSQGTKISAFSDEIMQAAQDIAFASYEALALEDNNFRESYTSWKAFRSEVYQWHQVSEVGYSNFVINNPVNLPS